LFIRLQPITRVHALNILRAAVLDAPLAEDVRPFMGDAIVSSILGYDDEDWAVRNSATMVFAASIVRVVDADKNASETTKSGGVKVTTIFPYATVQVHPHNCAHAT
jgi:hypothetical protein